MARKKGQASKKPALLGEPVGTDVIPSGYAELLEDLKGRIRAAQVKASLSVNRELIHLYWQIGQEIVRRQEQAGWGQKVIDRLGNDLQKAFPGVAGFSRSNIYRMRVFYQACAAIVPQAVGQLVAVGPPDEFSAIPWGHNAILLEKIKDAQTRLWYARKAIEHGWSRNTLALQIGGRLHERQGKAVTNYAQTLPTLQSDLAVQLLKDPYNFDFLTLTEDAHERELELGLLSHIREFLLELGVGFAFVRSQYPLEVAGEDFFLDLLFYHCKLHCYFVIDLKMEEFQPEHAGKMNFYLSAVDDLIRDKAVDQPTLGLILCRKQNKMIAEYALRDIAKPIGVAGFETRLVESLPKELEGKLPSIERLEEELGSLGKSQAEGGDDDG